MKIHCTGYLSDPVQKYPALFAQGGRITDFLTEYPYSLPCFAASSIASLGWIAGFLFLEETLTTKERREGEEEEQALLADDAAERDQAFEEEACGRERSCCPSRLWATTLTPAVVAICATYGLVAYQNVFYDGITATTIGVGWWANFVINGIAELFPIWSATREDEGGLGLDSSELGSALSFAGCVTLFVQFFFFHRLTAWFGGSLRLFRLALLLSIVVFGLHGCIRYLYGQGTPLWGWVGLLTGLGMKTLCQTVVFTGVVVLINNAAPRRDALGAINAFSQCKCGAK